jgi:hypothetical protein
MAQSSLETHRSSTGLGNTTYNIICALAQEADFLYSTVDTYIDDARKENRSQAEQIWQTIKVDKRKHILMLKEVLSKEAAENKIR